MPEVCERREAEERSCTISVFRLQCGAGGVRHEWKERFLLQRIRECGRTARVIPKCSGSGSEFLFGEMSRL